MFALLAGLRVVGKEISEKMGVIQSLSSHRSRVDRSFVNYNNFPVVSDVALQELDFNVASLPTSTAPLIR